MIEVFVGRYLSRLIIKYKLVTEEAEYTKEFIKEIFAKIGYAGDIQIGWLPICLIKGDYTPLN